ncbi:hypothetical protein HMPREF3144_01180 [Oligella sp. HMSC05A10]|uniref:hypothetical protein n=1 Tax=Oligella sp. HMSC05A10 TaxID=1581112 RepID=UPI0008A54004|nr:hypothetical protein [Oligella sp. HMSC05A10]OFS89150.1 hypothetical protein HMPREF3144_01180 [Oligella sp. HMSC05A10]
MSNSYLRDKLLSNSTYDPDQTKNKLLDIARASQDKSKRIAELMPGLVADKERYDESMIGKLGLERGSLAAATVNNTGRVANGALRLLGNVLTGRDSALLEKQAFLLPERDIELYNKNRQGTITPEEREELFKYNPDTETSPYSRVQEMVERRKGIEDFRNLLSIDDSRFYDSHRDKLVRELRQNWENFKDNPDGGLGTLVGSSLLSAVSNPSATTGLAGENVANILAAAYSKGTSLLAEMPSEVSRQTSEYILNHAKENQGALPTKGQLDESRLWSVAGASLDAAGDRFITGLSKAALAPTKAVKGATKAAKEASEETAKNVSRLRKLANFAGDNMATRTGKAYLGGFASEFPIGAAQGYTEAKAQLEDPTGEDIYLSGMLEGMGGGGMTGGVRGVAEVISAPMRRAATKEAQRQAEIAKKEEAIAKRAERVRTGNVDDIADSTHADYDPKEAV